MSDFKLTLSTVNNLKLKIDELFASDPSKKYRFKIIQWSDKRSLTANKQQHLWYGQIAKYNGHESPLSVKNFCKYNFALPIFMGNSVCGVICKTLFNAPGFLSLTYECRLKAMQNHVHTSDMTVEESKKYMDQMIYYYNDIGIPIQYRDK